MVAKDATKHPILQSKELSRSKYAAARLRNPSFLGTERKENCAFTDRVNLKTHCEGRGVFSIHSCVTEDTVCLCVPTCSKTVGGKYVSNFLTMVLLKWGLTNGDHLRRGN